MLLWSDFITPPVHMAVDVFELVSVIVFELVSVIVFINGKCFLVRDSSFKRLSVFRTTTYLLFSLWYEY